VISTWAAEEQEQEQEVVTVGVISSDVVEVEAVVEVVGIAVIAVRAMLEVLVM